MKHLIIVEDDEDDLDFLREGLLSVEDVEITNYKDGLALLKALDHINASNKPDAIIMDLLLPFMDGIEILAELKSNKTHSEIPVIMFTSSILHEEICMKAGCAKYYMKPNSMKEYSLLAQDIMCYLDAANC